MKAPHAAYLLLALAALDGCATSGTSTSRSSGPSASAQPGRRRRRARRPTPPAAEPATPPAEGTAQSTPVTAPTTGPGLTTVPPTVTRAPATREPSPHSFGSPVVTRPQGAPELTPRWSRVHRQWTLSCDGETAPRLISPQAPPTPTTAAIVRTFHPAEHAVLACNPPPNEQGRFALRAVFVGSGAPQEFSFLDLRVTEPQALCMGRALCALRLPPFRAVNASVAYEYVVALPDDGARVP